MTDPNYQRHPPFYPPQQPGNGAPQQPSNPVLNYPPQQQTPEQPPVSAAEINQLGAALRGAREGNASGRYLPAGKYVWDIEDCKIVSTFNKGPAFIASCLIVESDNPDVQTGDRYDYVRMFTDKYGHGVNDIKGLICQVIEQQRPGSSPGAQWDDNFLAWIVSPEQPARGTRWFDHAYEQQKKREAGSFTKHEIEIMAPGATRGLVSSRAPTPAPADPIPVGPLHASPQHASPPAPWQGQAPAPVHPSALADMPPPPGWQGPWPPSGG